MPLFGCDCESALFTVDQVRRTMTHFEFPYPRVFLLPGRDRRIASGHPWAFSNEIRMDAETKALPPGSLATLHRVDGKSFGVCMFNPHALIAGRLISRNAEAQIDVDFLSERLQRAHDMRMRLFRQPYFRWVHAEGDGFPGLVADLFGKEVVLQINTAGMEALTPTILEAIDRVVAPKTIVLRNDSRARALEGLNEEVRLAKGSIVAPSLVHEGSLKFPLDTLKGQKTGWFYDQRHNRAFIAQLAKSGRLLDVYCHTGAFSISAASAGAAEILGIDSSETAIDLANEGARLNSVAETCHFKRSDAFAALADLAAAGERFDVVVTDPPAFVKAKKELNSGLRGYRKLARLAAGLVAKNGYLFVASCSHHVDATAFLNEVQIGLDRAGRESRILRASGAGPDHPVHPHVPETAYLKTLVFQLD